MFLVNQLLLNALHLRLDVIRGVGFEFNVLNETDFTYSSLSLYAIRDWFKYVVVCPFFTCLLLIIQLMLWKGLSVKEICVSCYTFVSCCHFSRHIVAVV